MRRLQQLVIRAKSLNLRTMSSNCKPRLAILDDYQNIAASKFSCLSSRVDVVDFPETLNPKLADGKKALIERLKPFTIICTMRERTPLLADVLGELPKLKLLTTTGMRNASIDLKKCAEEGVIVSGTTGSSQSYAAPPGYDSTTQHTWALILGIARNIARDDAAVKNGGWQGSLATGLAGKTLGLLGLGRLGGSTARIAVLGFDMRITAWSSSLTQQAADEKAKGYGLPAGTFRVVASKEELFRTADVLSVHYVLSDRSRGIVGEKELSVMKSTALLVNTSRGPLIDEKALLSTLKAGRIRGAALDVFDVEPLPSDSEWRSTSWGRDGSSEVLLSPHMGYAEELIMHAWYDETVANVEKWLDGEEVNAKL